jgi:hypothetical protein
MDRSTDDNVDSDARPASGASRAVVFVEGLSDQRAVEALGARRGRDLDAEGIAIMPIGGATTIGHYLRRYGPRGLNVRLAGLCDTGEKAFVRRALEREGFGSNLSRADLEDLGFFVCVLDLEDELIRALGTSRVEDIVESQGELASFRRFQKQPAQRPRPVDQQLRRFLGTRAGRKIRYGSLLVDALDLDRVPGPLDRLLEHLRDAS